MIEYLTYYYSAGTVPFRSLSALPEKEAIQIMKELYTDDAVWGRFKDAFQYLRERREIEQWLRQEFIKKGGRPQKKYPIYMVMGTCEKLENYVPAEKLCKIQIPISQFKEEDISFTFMDSMFSYSLSRNQSSEYYQREYHGKVFTLPEIILFKKGDAGRRLVGRIPTRLFPVY
jgi:hypothetical protein